MEVDGRYVPWFTCGQMAQLSVCGRVLLRKSGEELGNYGIMEETLEA